MGEREVAFDSAQAARRKGKRTRPRSSLLGQPLSAAAEPNLGSFAWKRPEPRKSSVSAMEQCADQRAECGKSACPVQREMRAA